MKLFIVAVPYFNSDTAVVAYELRYQCCEKLYGLAQSFESIDTMINSPGIELLNLVGLEPFTGGKPIFIPINKYLLLANFQRNLTISPENLVCVITDEVPIDEVNMEKCMILKEQGFKIAVKNIRYTPESTPLFELADYFIVDTASTGGVVDVMQIRIKNPHLQVAFINIASKDVYNSIKQIPSSLFEGRFYSQPVTKGVTKISPLKLSSIELLKLANSEDFEVSEASKIITRDPALSISLLKFINSPAIGVRSRVSSISHAVAMLGQIETVKWIKVAVSMYMAEDKPSEITKLSLIRAKFAENLAGLFSLGVHASSLFLMGIFSVLDIVLNMPMERAIEFIAVDENIKDALVYNKGKFADVINFIFAYEQANWEKCSYMMILHEIDVEAINKTYLEALSWYRNLLDDMEYNSESSQ